jgi:glycosyltransferase involved in cell wall biosynthesis
VIPKVLYSVAIPLNRGGMSTIAWHACKGLMDAGLLQAVVAPETDNATVLGPFARELPFPFRLATRALNRFGWHYLKDSFFDRWAANWILPGCHYYGWMHQSLACIRKCHAGGGKTFIDRGSVEVKLQQRWLEKEYSKYKIASNPIPRWTYDRMLIETEETDFVVAPSTLVADSYLAAGYRSCKLLVNPLGVDGSVFFPATEVERAKRETFRFVFVGQLSLQKGIPQLLDAWNKLSPDNAQLVLAGTIPSNERNVIEPLIQQTRGVKWDGHQTDVPGLLRSCDVLVLPSAQDGFGLVVLEALSSGLPVIVSDRVGAKDCVLEGKNGFVFAYEDQEDLEDRMKFFLNDRSRSGKFSKSAVERAGEYTWEGYGKRFMELFSNENLKDHEHEKCE